MMADTQGLEKRERLYQAYVQDCREIFDFGDRGARLVGVTLKVYDDLAAEYKETLARHNEYRDKLIELGEIDPPPPTLEQLVEKQAKALDEATEKLAKLAQFVDELTKPPPLGEDKKVTP